ncbi:hypothetical protein TL16_g12488 [Triparma laevis f. inornata]|uniref:Hcy-binding domain-containing protein n=2 Tax=Triparma laevis TaxID=1534972 RepID=A0A9W7FQB6_9STRA|nr:hypothetical protein TL16_g12488 [Triparma laevis f. inornata]GMI16318.1 hypothetical protein TrLO_g11835 [Triparma laevis f. longispina]
MSSPPLLCRIIDGGLSTQLESQGVDLTSHPKLWTAGLLSSPSGRTQLKTAHSNFAAAGADIILTSSYQASHAMSVELLHHSVNLALEIKIEKPEVKVFLSLGPYGATLADGSEYTGKYDEEVTVESLKIFHTERIDILLDGEPDVDGLAFETIPNSRELTSILEILKMEKYANYDTWITFSSPDGIHTCSGETFSTLIASTIIPAFKDTTAKRYIGLNCVHPSSVSPFLDIVLPLLPTSNISGIVAYPNNGGAWNPLSRSWEENDDDKIGYVNAAVEWRDRVWKVEREVFIGGCCSTDARTIRGLKEKLCNC